MNNPLKALLGSRVQPFTLPKTSLNPITHIEMVATALEVATIQKHNEAVPPTQVSAGRMAALSLQFSQAGFGVTTTPDRALPNGGVTGGGSAGGTQGGGTYSVLPETPADFGVDEPADYSALPEERATDADLDAARAPSGGGVYYAWAEPYTEAAPSGTPAGAIIATPPRDVSVSDLVGAAPATTLAARTVVDAITGSVYFQLLNRGAAPLNIQAEVSGRFGDFELFNTLIKRVMPPMRRPVKFKASWAFQGDDAGLFSQALMAEAGPTSKVTLVLDAVLQWNAFHHKITDARKVDAVIDVAV